MKKILLISASPRRGGNSDLLCDEFERGARDAGHEAEKVFLRDRKVGFCLGCNVCQRTVPCVQKDDAAEILERMVAADALVFGTPVYFYTMDAQLKTLIDRSVARFREMSGKDIYIIVAAALSERDNIMRAVESIRGFTQLCLQDAREKGVLLATNVWAAGDVRSSPEMLKAYEMGQNV